MASDNQMNLIIHGRDAWNDWRNKNPLEKPDFRHARLPKFDFSGFDLEDADFRRAILREAVFKGAHLSRAIFSGANAAKATFSGAILQDADLSDADLSRASFYEASLIGANLTGSNLFVTAFRAARFGGTVFADIDLETAIGLDEVIHESHSSLSVDTLIQSSGNISKVFLHNVGFPDIFVHYIPSLLEANAGIRFHSCFISYSHEDEAFALRLRARMREERIRVWFAPEEMQGGKKLFDQIERAIHMHDKVLLVLSATSIKSNWVETEIRKTHRQELSEGRRNLFPIRLVDMKTLQAWSCPDADSGRDLAAWIRAYYIPDFSEWIIENKFEMAFARLRQDLRKEGIAMKSE
jgi:TIR domain/Pentapeptide repeats (8 copies)